MYMGRLAIGFGLKRKRRLLPRLPFILGFVPAIAFQSLLLVTSAHAQAASADPQRQSIGSLNTMGEVYVNETRAPSELAIFPGDAVRTGETGMATLTTIGKGSFQISRRSQVVFSANPQYLAELKLGTISLKSAGGTGLGVVRAGNFVVVQTNRGEQTAAVIEGAADGSFLITCSAGNMGVIPMQESSGLFLQAGQSARISPTNELTAVGTPPRTASANPTPAGTHHRTWIYLGLVGAAAGAGIAAAIVYSEGSHPPVSASAP